MPPRPPPAAYALLGEQAERLIPYAAMLASLGTERGLLGPRELPRLWERHLLNCAAPAPDLPAAAAVVDIGSGAGLPGLVWALLRPDLHLTLVDPIRRRADFLEHAVTALGLPRVEVRRARAEDLAGVLSADVVGSRAVAPLDRLARWCLPLVRPGGSMWALKGRSAGAEVEKSRPVLARAGAVDVRIATYGEGVLESPTTVVQVVRSEHQAGGDQR